LSKVEPGLIFNVQFFISQYPSERQALQPSLDEKLALHRKTPYP